MLKIEDLKRFSPNATDETLRGIIDAWPDMDRAGVNTPLRICHFMAQYSAETMALTRFVESLNYSTSALKKLFSRRRISEADANKYGRNAAHAADQEAIANLIYGGSWGKANLGNTMPGDGWRFRGRGPQITGRSNYANVGKMIGVDLIKAPDALLDPETSTRALVAYWKDRDINAHADRNDIRAVTKAINGGYIGLTERKAAFVRAVAIWGDKSHLN